MQMISSTNITSMSGVTLMKDRRDIRDRKSTRLNSSHLVISYAVFCLKKKKDVPAMRLRRGKPDGAVPLTLRPLGLGPYHLRVPLRVPPAHTIVDTPGPATPSHALRA